MTISCHIPEDSNVYNGKNSISYIMYLINILVSVLLTSDFILNRENKSETAYGFFE